MRIYWRISDIPELAGLTPQEQRQAWRACYRRAPSDRRFWLATGVGAVWMYVVDASATLMGAQLVDLKLIFAIFGGGGMGFIMSFATTHILRPHLKEYVASHFPEKTDTPVDAPDAS